MQHEATSRWTTTTGVQRGVVCYLLLLKSLDVTVVLASLSHVLTADADAVVVRPMSVPLGTTRNSGGIAGSSSAATLASKKSVASLPPALDSRRPTSSDVKAVPAAAPSSSATTLPSIFRQ